MELSASQHVTSPVCLDRACLKMNQDALLVAVVAHPAAVAGNHSSCRPLEGADFHPGESKSIDANIALENHKYHSWATKVFGNRYTPSGVVIGMHHHEL